MERRGPRSTLPFVILALGLLVLGFLPGPIQTAAAQVPTFGTKHVFACGTSTGVTTGTGLLATTAGDSILVMVELAQPSAISVATMTDTATDTFQHVNSVLNSGNARIELWDVNNSIGAANNRLTVTWGTSARFCVSYLDFASSSAYNFAVYDKTGVGSTGNSGTCSDTVTTTLDADLIVLGCFVKASVTFTGSGSLTVNDSSAAAAGSGLMGTQIQSVHGSVSPAATFTSNQWAAMVIAVRAPPVPGAPTSLHTTSRTTTSLGLGWTNPTGGGLVNSSVYRWAGSSCSGTVTTTSIGSSSQANTQSGLASASSFSFEVASWNASGTSAVSSCLTVSTLPGPVTSLTVVSASTTSLLVSWTLPSGTPTNTSIWWTTTCSPPSGRSTASLGVVSSTTLTGLSPAVTYCVAVEAYVSGANGNSAPLYANGTTIPNAPTALTVGAVTTTTVPLSWTLGSGTNSNVTAYRWAGSSCSGTVTATSLGSGVTSNTQTGLAVASTFAFEVQAWSSGGSSAPSSCVTGTTLPTASTGLTVGTVTETTIPLTWVNSAGTLPNSTVYRWAGATCSGTVTTTSIGSAATSNTQSGLPGASQFSFEVVSWSAGGSSAVSSCVSGTTRAGLATGLTVGTITVTTVQLSFTLPGGTISNVTGWQHATAACSTSFSTNLGVVSSTTFSGLSGASPFCFGIQVFSSSGSSGTVWTNVTTRPSAPTGLTIGVVTVTTVALSWTLPTGTLPNATVERWAASSCTGSATGTSLGSALSSNTQTGLGGANTYSFEVFAWSSSGESAASSCVSATTLPNVASSFVVSSTGATTATATWVLPTGTLVNVSIAYTTTSCTSGWTYTSLGASATSASLGGLPQFTSLCFAVQAYSASGPGAPVFTNGTTQNALPPAPTNFHVMYVSQTHVGLTWTSPPKATTGALVKYGLQCNAWIWSVAVTWGNSTDVFGLASSTAYCFSVAVGNSSGYGPAAPSIVATTAGPTGGGSAPGGSNGPSLPGFPVVVDPTHPQGVTFNVGARLVGIVLVPVGLAGGIIADSRGKKLAGLLLFALGLGLILV